MPNFAHPIYNKIAHPHQILYRPMHVTVGIPTYKRPAFLNSCLASLLAQERWIAQIIIVTNGSVNDAIDETTLQLIEALETLHIDTLVLRSRNLVHSKRIIGENAICKYVLILDDDTVLGKNYLDLVSHFHWEQVGAISGTIQTPINPGYVDWSDEPVRFPEQEYCNRMIVENGVIEWKDKFQFYMWGDGPRIFKAEFLGGTALFIRRELIELWDDKTVRKGADGEWVIEGEEIDLSLSIREAGYDLLYDSARICWHLYAQTGRTRRSNYKDRTDNWNYILKKHGYPEIEEYPTVWTENLTPDHEPKI